MNSLRGIARVVAPSIFLLIGSPALAADDGSWSVSKSSGEVWLTSGEVEQASLTADKVLNPGDTVHTGRNGRVLLVRGEETILISPNSVIGLPKEKKDGLSTTITQQVGSILLDVEKRNVKHFEVETPFLAAVVKGTQFSVTVGAKSTNVSVKRGEVEVSDFKTGQIAHVMPGQAAAVFSRGTPGLVLRGSGTFNPIEQGKPRSPGIEPVRVPKGGLTPPQHTESGSGRQLSSGGPISLVSGHNVSPAATTKQGGVVRINSAIGEVKLNFHSVTKGLAHSVAVPSATRRSASTPQDSTSIWSGDQGSSSTPTSAGPNQPGGAGGAGNGGGGGISAAAAPPPSVVGPGGAGGGDGPPDKGPGGGDGPAGKGPGGGNGANGAGGKGPHGHGPDGNGPPGHGQGGPPGKGK